ncbi:hypothetical protein QBC38DRAFT_239212 [Podospora fimiseda]|uniref:Uncharacterized protein n=1 Tax=Podospora fimiseda TaxID=252190 RepID=A0AAN7BMM8_9PEZI|nr:hypothetical protein QBC38DRAFT_239212 [Podospora fimiseda]
MTAPNPTQPSRARGPVEMLPQRVNEVAVITGKAFKAASMDGKGVAEVAAVMNARIPDVVEKFNLACDEIELEILRSKAYILRDLNQLRAKRKPPPPPKQQGVAPPAPMESPILTAKAIQVSPFKPGISGPSRPSPVIKQESKPVIKQESKPVAPFPNMGLELTSPEVKHVSTPSPKPVHRPKGPENPVNPAAVAAAAGRPSSAPPRKETKIPAPQVPRSAGPPQAAPFPPGMQTKASSVPAPNIPAPNPPPAPVTTVAAAPPAPVPPIGNETFFTDMTFSLAPTPGEAQQGLPSQQQPQLQPSGGNNQGGVGNPTGPVDVANMDSLVDDDPKIKDFFNLEGIEMDYAGEEGPVDDNNFNELYFNLEDDSNGLPAGEFDNNFFNS